jgi:putative ATPase
MAEVLTRAANHLQIMFDAGAASLFIQYAGVDARKLINLVESFSQSSSDRSGSEGAVREFLKNSHVLVYDRSGEHHYNLISAFIKSMRGSDPDAALYWAFRMIESGEDPRFILRRMMIFASEDIGNADPRALQLAVATADAFDRLGLPEGRIPLAQCITYLASSPKSNRSYVAMNEVLSEIKDRPSVQVPLHLRNAPTGLLKQLGYGSDYKYPHDDAKGYVGGVQYLPDDLVGRRFYNPSQHGAEKALAERLSVLRGMKSSTEKGES